MEHKYLQELIKSSFSKINKLYMQQDHATVLQDTNVSATSMWQSCVKHDPASTRNSSLTDTFDFILTLF